MSLIRFTQTAGQYTGDEDVDEIVPDFFLVHSNRRKKDVSYTV
jgi:hypothetical protein